MSDSTAWVKVERRGLWKPENEGAELVGVYCGKVTIPGEHGPFEVVQVRCGDGGIIGVTGAVIVSLVKEAALNRGERVRIVFEGLELVGKRDNRMRKFGLYVAASGAASHGLTVGVLDPGTDPADPGPAEPPGALVGGRAPYTGPLDLE